jgi:toxin FitB
VTRYLLDTNIISNATKPNPSSALLAWMAEQADSDLFISALTVGEIRRGLLEKPAGKKRVLLEAWFAGPEGPQALFAGRVLSFDEKAALAWARLMADGTAKGRPRSALDMIIAAVADANDCVVVTDNEKDFIGLNFINPLRPTNAGTNRELQRDGAPTQVADGSQLAPLSLDIGRLMDRNLAAEMWDRYQRGESKAFTKRLYTPAGQKAFDEVARKYRADRGFKQTVDRYITEFERLLDEVAREDRGPQALRGHLTSETGMVYTLLAHAAGRLGKRRIASNE